MNEAAHNWAGNITYAAKSVHHPRSTHEVQELVRGLGKVRAIGSRHSFSRIADSDEALISLRNLNRIVSLDKDARQVTVEGGMTYGELCPLLDAEGFALGNLASLPHISIAGACATATHGSGNANRNLAAAVSALEIVTATGDAVTISRGDADFDGAVVNLGALGIVTRITLDLLPHFAVRQNVYTGLPFQTLLGNFDALTSSAYSVSFFTHWHGDEVAQVWLKRRADSPHAPTDFFGARPVDRPYHPIASIDPAPATEQMGVEGPWHERLPHFRLAFTPSAGAELQSEYFVSRANVVEALARLRQIQHEIAPHLLVSEIRTIAADELWMSPCYQQESVGIHFTWKLDWPAVSGVLPLIEEQLVPLGARPHWGKLFTMSKADVQTRYPRLKDFRALLERIDPDGKFRNSFVNEYVF